MERSVVRPSPGVDFEEIERDLRRRTNPPRIGPNAPAIELVIGQAARPASSGSPARTVASIPCTASFRYRRLDDRDLRISLAVLRSRRDFATLLSQRNGLPSGSLKATWRGAFEARLGTVVVTDADPTELTATFAALRLDPARSLPLVFFALADYALWDASSAIASPGERLRDGELLVASRSDEPPFFARLGELNYLKARAAGRFERKPGAPEETSDETFRRFALILNSFYDDAIWRASGREFVAERPAAVSRSECQSNAWLLLLAWLDVRPLVERGMWRVRERSCAALGAAECRIALEPADGDHIALAPHSFRVPSPLTPLR